MSSTFNVADSSDDKDGSLILYVNVDGTINVDQETLNKILANQYDTGNVSVVRVDNDTGGGENVNLMIERFGAQQITSQSSSTAASTQPDTTSSAPSTQTDIATQGGGDVTDVVIDPFSQMDPEQLERLENALQSEQAKEILGTNLEDNLLEMLEGGGESCRMEDSAVHNDHSYTTPLSSPMKQSGAKTNQTANGAAATAAKQQPTQAVTSSGVAVQPPVSTAQSSTAARNARARAAKGARVVVATTTAPAAIVTSTTKTGNIVVTRPAQQIVRPAGVMARAGRAAAIVAAASGTPTMTTTGQRFVIKRGTKIVTSTSPANGVVGSRTPKILQRRVVAQKPLAPKPNDTKTSDTAATLAAQSLVQMASELQTIAGKKETPSTKKVANKGGRKTPKGKSAVQPVTAAVVTASSIEQVDDEMAAALEAMHADTGEQVASKSPSPTKKSPPKGKKTEEVKKGKTTAQPAKQAAKRLKSPEAQSKAEPHSHEEVRKRRDRSGSSCGKPEPQLLGPELFSHPDIIRRVSVDKPKSDVDQASAVVDDKSDTLNQTVSTADPPLSSVPSTSLSENKAGREEEIVGTESLLNSLTDVTKEESKLLAEALLLDDLTNDVLGPEPEVKGMSAIAEPAEGSKAVQVTSPPPAQVQPVKKPLKIVQLKPPSANSKPKKKICSN